MARLKNILPSQILKLIYTSLILPRIHYGNLAWGYAPGRIEILQKKALRIIGKKKYNDHTEPILKEQKLLSVKDIHISKKLTFFYKLENNMLPSYFWSYMFKANKTKSTY